MVEVGKLWETDPVEYLVQMKFPDLIFKQRAARKSSSDELRNFLVSVEGYRQQVRTMPESDRQLLIAETRQDEISRYNEYRESQERNQFFNQTAADADVSHWASASYWTLDETAALSLGKDPRIVTWERVSPHVNISPFAKAFEAQRDLIYRASVMSQLAKQTAPSVVIAWAERMHQPMPAELVEAVNALGTQIADWKTLHDDQVARAEQLQEQLYKKHKEHMATYEDHSQYLDEMREKEGQVIRNYEETLTNQENIITSLKREGEALAQRIIDLEAVQLPSKIERELGTRERESLLKLVIGMAMGAYCYNPKASRNSATKEIADDLMRSGVPLDEDTVRKYIVEAKQLLPGDEPEKS